MRRPRSQAHTSVLALCVFGCLWVASTDERLPDAPQASIATETRAASSRPLVELTVDPAGAPLDPAPFAERSPGPRTLERILGNAAGPVRPVLTP